MVMITSNIQLTLQHFKVLDGVVTNETFFDYFINGTLADYVPEGATFRLQR